MSYADLNLAIDELNAARAAGLPLDQWIDENTLSVDVFKTQIKAQLDAMGGSPSAAQNDAASQGLQLAYERFIAAGLDPGTSIIPLLGTFIPTPPGAPPEGGPGAPGTSPSPPPSPTPPPTPGTTPETTPPTTPPTSAPTWLDGFLRAIEDAIRSLWLSMLAGVNGFFSSRWQYFLSDVVTPVRNFAADLFSKAKDGFARIFYGVDNYDDIDAAADRTEPVNHQSSFEEVQAFVASTDQAVNNPRGIVEFVVSWIFKAALAVSSITATFEPYITKVTQTAKAETPVETLGVGDIIKARRWQIMGDDSASAEMLLNGINDSRQTILEGIDRYQPSPPEVASWHARNLINDDQYNFYLTASAMTPDNISAFQNTIVKDVDPRSLIQIDGQSAAARDGFLSQSLSAQAPDSVRSLYTRNLVNPQQADVDWQSRVTVPPYQYFIELFYRGLATEADVQNAARAHNYPSELYTNLIEAQRPLLPIRVLLSLVQRKIMDEATAQRYMSKLGYDEQAQTFLLEYVKPLKTPKATAAADEMSKISLATAASLYDQQAIDDAGYQRILTAHGFQPDAAKLQTQALSLRQAAEARKADALDIVNEVDLGFMTIDDAVSQLIQAGYSQSEVLKYQKMMRRTKAANAKVPSLAQVVAMWKAELIDESIVQNYLTTQNYDSFWIPYILKLEAPKSATP